MGFDDRWLARTLTQISAHWYSWQTWSISMHCSQKAFHFLIVSNGPTSILSGFVITLRKVTRNYFCGVFFMFLREMFLRRLRDVTEKTSFLRCFWDVLKTSQKVISFETFLRGPWDVSLNGDLIGNSQKHLMPAGLIFV